MTSFFARKFSFSFFFLSCIFQWLAAQIPADSSLPGGFTYNWSNYDLSVDSGLGPRVPIFDFTDIRPIFHAPPVGVHPRVFFGPNEKADILNRLANTTSGRRAKAQMHAFTTLLHRGNTYDHNTNYGSDHMGNRWIGNVGFWNSQPYYYQLINADSTVWDNVEIKRKHLAATLMALEALECYLYLADYDPDTELEYSERANRLSSAMTFWASLAINDPDVNASGSNFNHFGGTHMALAYDLHYDQLSTAQRDLIRQALVKIIPAVPRHGGSLSAYANTSNWSTLNSFEIIINLAIEGEPGYNTELTKQWMRAAHTFINYGWYESGAGYEGLGKNYQFVTTLVACAKRGYSLLGHPHVKAYGTEFLPAIMQPFGHGFTSYDVWGGSGYNPKTGGYKFSPADVVGLKWVFPQDEKIDFVWRNYIEKAEGQNSTGYVYQQIRPDDSYYNYLIPAIVFAMDYDSTDWQSQADFVINPDFIAEDRGLAVLRSGTDQEDLAMQFHCRQDMGGHTHGDRNDFTLSALGRTWIKKTYGGSQFQPTWFHSCIIIDGKGVGVGDPDGDKCRQPGILLEHEINDDFSMVAGDATYAYTWEWHWSPQAGNDHPWLGTNGWEKVLETWNDFQYIPKSEAHFNIPFYEYPHWHQADRKERMIKRLHNPMEKVIRTVGMFKGTHPFSLVIDDVKKDDSTHVYQWLGQIARDLVIDTMVVPSDYLTKGVDVILKSENDADGRRLLVKILQDDGYVPGAAPAFIDTLGYFDYFTGNPYNSNPNFDRLRLVIESECLTPNYKVLFFPFHSGDELLCTEWNTTRDTLAVFLPSDTLTIAFELGSDGRTHFDIVEPLIFDPVISLKDQSWSVFPNPSRDHIQINGKKGVNYEIKDVQGKLLRKGTMQNEKQVIDLRNFSQGIYFLKYEENGLAKSIKFVVQ